MTARLEAPAHYDDERRTIWADTVSRLTSSGRVFRADPEILNTYVEAVRSHRQASRLLAQTNVLVTRDGKVSENPALAVQRRSAEAMARASKALGLDRAPGMPDGPSMTAPDPVLNRDGKCGGKKKQGDGTCTQAAGWGTPHPGTGRCKLHGGCAPSSVAAGLNEQAARELARLDVPPVTDPLTELARLAAQAVAWKDNMAAKVNQLSSLRYESATGGEQLRAEIALWERALDRCVSTLTAMAKLNLEGRMAAVREATARMLEQALDAALEQAGVGLDKQAEAREVFRRSLKVVA